ncbi:MAG: AsmA family protein, partial [Elusimicrobia bacterium]|nr:AsmA family protein [Elusimicrobiota bacterium]
MTQKSIKIILISAITVILFFIAIIITARILFTPQRVARTAEAAASDFLKRDVKIKSARLGFAKIILEGIEVENKSSSMKLFLCEKIEAKFKIFPLFKKQIHINELYIRSPRINLDNKLNIDVQSLMTARMASIVKGAYTRFAIKKLDLKDANINFYPPEFPAVSLKNIDIKIEGRSIQEPASLSVKLNPGLRYIDNIDLNATLNILKDETFINQFTLGGKNGKIDI